MKKSVRALVSILLLHLLYSNGVLAQDNWLPNLVNFTNSKVIRSNLPQAVNDMQSTLEDIALPAIDVLQNDSDADGDALRVVSASAQNGQITVNADYSLYYQPNQDFHGEDVVHYTVTDGTGISASATVQINVSPQNDAPVAENDRATVLSGSINNIINITQNDYDADEDALSVSSATAVYGEVQINADNSLTYTPPQGFGGADTIEYTIEDPSGTSSSTWVTVNAVPNSTPVITGQSQIVIEEDQILTMLLEHFEVADVDSSIFALTLGNGPNFTILSGDRVRPVKNYYGTLLVPVTVSDGESTSETFYAAVEVTPKNDAPYNVGSLVKNIEESSSYTFNFGALFYDPEAQLDPQLLSSFTYELVNLEFVPLVNYQTTLGTLRPAQGRPHGWYTYTPDEGKTGKDALFFFVRDELGARSTRGDLVFTVVSVQGTPPKVTGQIPISVAEDSDVTLTTSMFTIEDPESSNFTLSIADGAGENYSVISATNTIKPKKDYFGEIYVPIIVSDGNNESVEFIATVTVNNVDDVPRVFDYTVNLEQGTHFNNIHFRTGMMFDPDVKNDDSLLDQFIYHFGTATNTSGRTAHGQISQAEGQKHGVFNYTPDPDFIGEDAVPFWVTDNTGLQSAQGLMTYRVTSDSRLLAPDRITLTPGENELIVDWSDSTNLTADASRYEVYSQFNNQTWQLKYNFSDTTVRLPIYESGTYDIQVRACKDQTAASCSEYSIPQSIEFSCVNDGDLSCIQVIQWQFDQVTVGQPIQLHGLNGVNASTCFAKSDNSIIGNVNHNEAVFYTPTQNSILTWQCALSESSETIEFDSPLMINKIIAPKTINVIEE